MTWLTALVTAVLIFRATGSSSVWLALFAAPLILVAVWLYYFARNLLGWNRMYRATWHFDRPAEKPLPQLTLRLQPKDQTIKFYMPDIDCWLLTPSGERFLAIRQTPYRPGGLYTYWAYYPDMFKGTPPPLNDGTYVVCWIEERPSGKRREVLSQRLTVALS